MTTINAANNFNAQLSNKPIMSASVSIPTENELITENGKAIAATGDCVTTQTDSIETQNINIVNVSGEAQPKDDTQQRIASGSAKFIGFTHEKNIPDGIYKIDSESAKLILGEDIAETLPPQEYAALLLKSVNGQQTATATTQNDLQTAVAKILANFESSVMRSLPPELILNIMSHRGEIDIDTLTIIDNLLRYSNMPIDPLSQIQTARIDQWLRIVLDNPKLVNDLVDRIPILGAKELAKLLEKVEQLMAATNIIVKNDVVANENNNFINKSHIPELEKLLRADTYFNAKTISADISKPPNENTAKNIPSNAPQPLNSLNVNSTANQNSALENLFKAAFSIIPSTLVNLVKQIDVSSANVNFAVATQQLAPAEVKQMVGNVASELSARSSSSIKPEFLHYFGQISPQIVSPANNDISVSAASPQTENAATVRLIKAEYPALTESAVRMLWGGEMGEYEKSMDSDIVKNLNTLKKLVEKLSAVEDKAVIDNKAIVNSKTVAKDNIIVGDNTNTNDKTTAADKPIATSTDKSVTVASTGNKPVAPVDISAIKENCFGFISVLKNAVDATASKLVGVQSGETNVLEKSNFINIVRDTIISLDSALRPLYNDERPVPQKFYDRIIETPRLQVNAETKTAILTQIGAVQKIIVQLTDTAPLHSANTVKNMPDNISQPSSVIPAKNIPNDVTQSPSINTVKNISNDIMQSSNVNHAKNISNDVAQSPNINTIKNISNDITQPSNVNPTKNISNDVTQSQNVNAIKNISDNVSQSSSVSPAKSILNDVTQLHSINTIKNISNDTSQPSNVNPTKNISNDVTQSHSDTFFQTVSRIWINTENLRIGFQEAFSSLDLQNRITPLESSATSDDAVSLATKQSVDALRTEILLDVSKALSEIFASVEKLREIADGLSDKLLTLYEPKRAAMRSAVETLMRQARLGGAEIIDRLKETLRELTKLQSDVDKPRDSGGAANTTPADVIRSAALTAAKGLESLHILSAQTQGIDVKQHIIALPVKMGLEWTEVQIKFVKKRGDKGKKGDNEHVSIYLNVAPSTIGEVSAHFDFHPPANLKLSIQFQKPEVTKWFKEQAIELREALSKAGLHGATLEFHNKQTSPINDKFVRKDKTSPNSGVVNDGKVDINA